MPKSTPKIYIACPWSPVGGGMFKIADYLNQSQRPQQAPVGQRATLAPLDTRGGGSALASGFVLATALGRLLAGRMAGQVRGVHVNMAERLSLFRKCTVVLWARAIGVPVVLHLHAAQLHHFYATLPKPVQAYVRWVFAKATCCVVLGKASQEFVVGTLQVPTSRVEIINNGVPAPTVARQPMSANGGKFRMFFLGNLSERKGVSDLLKALSKSKLAQSGQIEAIFAGGGDIESWRNQARELGVDGFTRFLGWCDQQQAAAWMASSDALVLPSYDEGLPLVILEALANSVAVICTPVGEIPHNLVHGKEAHFVAPGNFDELAAGLDNALGDAHYRHTLELGGRALFDRGFSLDHFADSVARVHLRSFGVAARPVALEGAHHD